METTKSSRAFLLTAVLLGVVATVAAFVYLDRSTGADHGPTVKVLVAKHDLRANTPLDPEKDFDELEIPARLSDMQARCLSPEHRAAYKGQRVNRKLLAGTPIMAADLVAAADLELKGDARAISLPVRGAQALGGLLVPGDYVKLLVTRPVMQARATPSTQSANTVADPDAVDGAGLVSGDVPLRWEAHEVSPQPFKVLAVGASLARSRQQITAADQYESAADSEAQQTVTLEVTEAQAKSILEQTGAGQLSVTLILCPPTPGAK